MKIVETNIMENKNIKRYLKIPTISSAIMLLFV